MTSIVTFQSKQDAIDGLRIMAAVYPDEIFDVGPGGRGWMIWEDCYGDGEVWRAISLCSFGSAADEIAQ